MKIDCQCWIPSLSNIQKHTKRGDFCKNHLSQRIQTRSLNEFKKTPHTLFYPKKEINTPAAIADPITPETLLAIQYCRI
jgi:hypothetical protein